MRSAIDLFESGGWSAVKPSLRGRARGDGRVLSAAQESTIQRLIIDTRPEQLKMDFGLWSRAAVGQLIEQEFGDVRGRSFAPMGKTPVVMAVGGTRHKLSMIATVTNQGKARWMIIDEAFDAEKLIEFLQALVKDAAKKVFLILDNLRVHHSRLVKAWVAERHDQIELFYLPSYSPQLNPEERLNADLKQEICKRVPVKTKAKLRQAANDHMAMLEQNPERVMSYFQDRRVRYAA